MFSMIVFRGKHAYPLSRQRNKEPPFRVPESTHNSMRDTLFGDVPLDQWPLDILPRPFPWSAFALARAKLAVSDIDSATGQWRQVLAAPGLEPRHYLQAWHFLRQHGQQPPPDVAKQVLGVAVEVGMAAGLDLLAAYSDHSARYYNFSGRGIVWEHPDASLDPIIDGLLSISVEIVARIGPWEKVRPPAPPIGETRLCFLTPSGIHFGQASMLAMASNPLASRVLERAGTLMQSLIAKTKEKY